MSHFQTLVLLPDRIVHHGRSHHLHVRRGAVELIARTPVIGQHVFSGARVVGSRPFSRAAGTCALIAEIGKFLTLHAFDAVSIAWPLSAE